MTLRHTHKLYTHTHALGFDEKPRIVTSAEINTTHYLNQRHVQQIISESDYGNVEYKYKLCGKTAARLHSLTSQLKWRLNEGSGIAVYVIGIHDNGVAVGLPPDEFDETVSTLHQIAQSIPADCHMMSVSIGVTGGQCAEILVKSYSQAQTAVSLRVVCVGADASGKSTLVGTLISGDSDDGAGLSRMTVLKHRHEIESDGRSSSISRHLLGFDADGHITNHRSVGTDDWSSIINDSTKVCTLYDLPGHAQYIKTTMLSLIGQHADYALVTVAADQGVLRVTREHIGLTIALDIPIFVVITKVDACTDEQLQSTVSDVTSILNSSAVNKQAYVVRDHNDVQHVTEQLQHKTSITPIFCVSSVTSDGYTDLTSFLHTLPVNHDWAVHEHEQMMFTIDESFVVPDVGLVVSGTMLRGSVKPNDELLLGPLDDGTFVSCIVQSVHVLRRPCKSAVAGQSATLALTGVEYDQVRRGHVLLHRDRVPRAVIGFDADVTVLSEPSTGKLHAKYQSVMHLSTITQSTHVTDTYDITGVGVGETANVRFDLCYAPEYVLLGSKFVGRGSGADGKSKIIYSGTVTKLYYLDECVWCDDQRSVKHKTKQRRLSLKSRLSLSPLLTSAPSASPVSSLEVTRTSE